MERHAKTKEDKKREILRYLEENSEIGNILALSRKELLNEFSDGHYTRENVDEVIRELVEEEPVSKNQVKIEAVYTDKHEEEVLSNFEGENRPSLKGVLILGYYIFFASIVATDFFNQLLSGMSNEQILGASFVGILFTVISGSITIYLMDFVEEKIPAIREHKQFLYPTFGIFFIALALAFVASTYYSTKIPITALVSVPGTSVLGGAAVARYWNNTHEE